MPTPMRFASETLLVEISKKLFTFRPENAFIYFGHRAHAFVDKFLQALAAIGLRRINISFGVRGDTVNGVELPGLTSAIAEIGNFLKRVAQQDVDLFVGAV